jgi:hypothetical protein
MRKKRRFLSMSFLDHVHRDFDCGGGVRFPVRVAASDFCP